MTDPYDLERFVDAQERVYAQVLAELSQGAKRSHWMWFVFPQAVGLGHSAMSQRYAIKSRGEAAAYLAHPLLGSRLIECTELVLAVPDRSVHEIFGFPDDMKFQSSMTLFNALSSGGVFEKAVLRFFDGQPDQATLHILGSWTQ
jgi:uncharacterized protein (DUF1810 family)